jgi:hypothetical protein
MHIPHNNLLTLTQNTYRNKQYVYLYTNKHTNKQNMLLHCPMPSLLIAFVSPAIRILRNAAWYMKKPLNDHKIAYNFARIFRLSHVVFYSTTKQKHLQGPRTLQTHPARTTPPAQYPLYVAMFSRFRRAEGAEL